MEKNMDNIAYKFIPYPSFKSDRMILRKLELSDAKDMFEYCSKEEVSFYENWKPHKSIDETKDFLRWVRWQYLKKKIKTWAIELYSGKMIGTVSFVNIDTENKSAEIGYTISNSYWGQGYAKEAAYQLLRFAFVELDLERVQARVIKGNERSRKVLKKLGFSYEGTARNANFYENRLNDLMYFSILKGEFFTLFGK